MHVSLKKSKVTKQHTGLWTTFLALHRKEEKDDVGETLAHM
jgi:hypothetical protein